MKYKFLIMCLLLAGLNGCVTIVKWKYGITNPREQTPEQISSYLKKHKYPGSGQYVFADSSAYFQSFRNPLFRKNLFGYMIFNASGELLQRDTAKCQWSGFEVISALNHDSVYEKQDGMYCGDILQHLREISAGSAPDTTQEVPDFTVIVTWAKFIGTLNARLFELSDAVNKPGNARVRMIWLNIDMQECWHLTKNQKMELR
jgi:hypothetical protein